MTVYGLYSSKYYNVPYCIVCGAVQVIQQEEPNWNFAVTLPDRGNAAMQSDDDLMHDGFPLI